jgi:hypothetical protein
MSKITFFLKAAFVVFAIFAHVAAQTPDTRWFYNAGTAKDTFWISTAEELAGLSQIVNDAYRGGSSFRGKTVVLANDIDLKDWGNWVSIGTMGTVVYDDDTYELDVQRPFSGVFDGNGKKIIGIKVSGQYYNGLFGFVINGEVKNVGIVDVSVVGVGVDVSAGGSVYSGGVVGYLDSGVVTGCYSTGIVSGSAYIGGVVGRVNTGNVTNCYSSAVIGGSSAMVGGVVGALEGTGSIVNCYSTGNVGRDPYRPGKPVQDPGWVGGVVGNVRLGGLVAGCYSTGEISGYDGVGGVVGALGYDYGEDSIVSVTNSLSCVTNSVALNPRINATVQGGRVIGKAFGGRYENNFAFSRIRGMFPDVTGASTINGADITLEKILADKTLENNFTEENGWTTERDRLPGLLGNSVEIPYHLFYLDAIVSRDREIPAVTVAESSSIETIAAVAPLGQLTAEFTAGPNPVDKRSGSGVVNFYYHGKRIKSGTLSVYDNSGNIVGKISLRKEPAAAGNRRKRLIATWDLRDRRGRPAPKGTYSVRGTVMTADKETERVSAVVGVR